MCVSVLVFGVLKDIILDQPLDLIPTDPIPAQSTDDGAVWPPGEPFRAEMAP